MSICFGWRLALLVLLAACTTDLPRGDESRTDTDDSSVTHDDAAIKQTDATLDAVAADCSRVRVVTDGRDANLRMRPTTESPAVGTVSPGTVIEVLAVVVGQTLSDHDRWFEVMYGSQSGFLFGLLGECAPDAALSPPPPAFRGFFFIPLACGTEVRVSQGNATSFSHQGRSKYAFDFALGLGTPMVAMAQGEVSYVYDKTRPGDGCYDGGGPSCINAANQVWVRHPDGTQTQYAHLSKVSVALGQQVTQGQELGLSGQTGYSTGPHAHVARMQSCCQSIPLQFLDVPGGVPKTGDMVTSGNCP